MPASETIHNANGVQILIDDDFGQLVDISGSSNEFTLKGEKDVEKYRVFGDRNYHRLENGHDFSIDLNIMFSRGRKEGSEIMHYWFKQGGLRRVVVRAPLNTTGGWQYSGMCILSSIEVSGKAEDAKPMMIKSKIEPDGDIDFQRVTS